MLIIFEGAIIMAIPNRVSSITVPDTVMYNASAVNITWEAVTGATGYALYIKGNGESSFSEVYEGADTAFNINMANYPDYNRMVLRVYSVNSDGASLYPCESKEITVIDIKIEEDSAGTMTLQPFNMIINAQASRFGDVPAVRETSETITGLDGEIPVDMKYSPRLFDLVCFMKSEFASISARETYIKSMSAHINRSVRSLRYMLFRNKIYAVKRISSEFDRRPSYCNLDISFKAYDVFGYGTAEKILEGNGTAINGGEEACYPIIILEGEQNNPTITVNSVDYQLALDTQGGDIITIDCEKETVMLEESDGTRSYLAGAYYLEFPFFKAGSNSVNGCARVKWREKYFTV
jgi:phage-related protein